LAARQGDFERVHTLIINESLDPNPRCPEGRTPLDRALGHPDICMLLFSNGGRLTWIGSNGIRTLCDRQQTLFELRASTAAMVGYVEFYSDFRSDDDERAVAKRESIGDAIRSASASMAEMQSNNIRRVEHVNYPPKSWQKPTQALIFDDLKEPPFPNTSKNTEGVADISCSPMSWQNTTEAPTPEELKGSPFPMSRYLGSSAGSAAISIRGSSHRSSYQNSSLRQTSLMRMAMLAKGSQGEQQLRKEDWEQHELWATPRLPTPKW
jgi:hypothetical protein